MSIIRKTLEENYIFFVRELARINEEIGNLSKGNISAKKIGKSTYYYHQWREGKQVKSFLLGLESPSDLIKDINRRKTLENQRRDILENIAVIDKAIDIQGVTAEEIIRVFSQNDIRITLIGSYYLSVLKENMGFHLPTIKTQEFLTPERSKGIDQAVSIKPLKVKAAPLRYLEMFFHQQVKIEKEGYTFLVPSPWVFAYHKILISKKRKSTGKREKDILQVNAILREISKRPEMVKKASLYLETLPTKWKKDIKNYITEHLPKVSFF
jgi:hypothetical protein